MAGLGSISHLARTLIRSYTVITILITHFDASVALINVYTRISILGLKTWQASTFVTAFQVAASSVVCQTRITLRRSAFVNVYTFLGIACTAVVANVAMTLEAPWQVDAVSVETTEILGVYIAFVNVLADAFFKLITCGAKALITSFNVYALAETTGVGVGLAFIGIHADAVAATICCMISRVAQAGKARRVVDAVPINTRVVIAFVNVHAGLVDCVHLKP